MAELKKAGIRSSHNPKKLSAMRSSTDETKMSTAGCWRNEPMSLPVKAAEMPNAEFMTESPRI
jgi:hypothetical protein